MVPRPLTAAVTMRAPVRGLYPFDMSEGTGSRRRGSGDAQDLEATLVAGVQYSSGIELSGMPLVTSLFGLHELGYSLFISIGDCESESSGMAGLKDLSGLDALNNLIVLSIVNNEALESLAGAPMLNEVQVLNVVNNPLIDAADVAAFLAPTDIPPIEACLGPWGECVCAGPPPS